MATRRPRKPKEENQSVTNVGININGAYIEVQNVQASKAGPTLARLLDVIRTLQKKYPELRVIHPTTGGYATVEYRDDLDWQEGPRKIGFTPK